MTLAYLPHWQYGFLVVLASAALAHAAPVAYAAPDPRNVVTAEPPLVRPAGRSCTVTLYQDVPFGDRGANNRMDAVLRTFDYHPPAGCPGPWQKIILEADYRVDPGRQYDRTASIWLNGHALYFGTTQEPSPDFGPSWHVERDLTDYATIFHAPSAGATLVNNWLDDKRASIIHGSARLVFYPQPKSTSAPEIPSVIYALSDGRNAATDLQSGADSAQRILSLPRNITHAYIDLIAQSQFHDEFWYMCLPEAAIEKTAAFAMKRGYQGAPKRPRACGGGAFRDVAVFIDGQPAGRAPVFPWIYTGGLLPYLWRPVPGIQTLRFQPYRLDITPFAGLLNDGKQHVVAVRVPNAHQYFSIAASLLVIQDGKNSVLPGGIVRNTLAADLPVSTRDTLKNTHDTITGQVETATTLGYTIEGYLDRPEGRVTTSVSQNSQFRNTKDFHGTQGASMRETVDQATHTEDTTAVTAPAVPRRQTTRTLDYGLLVESETHPVSADAVFREVHVHQSLADTGTGHGSIHMEQDSAAQGTVDARHVLLTPQGKLTARQSYSATDSQGHCMTRSVSAENGAVIAQDTSDTCSR